MTIKIGINGFGRIGRQVFHLLAEDPDMEVVGINDITDAATLAHLLKYDSVHGIYHRNVSHIQTNTKMAIVVDDKEYTVWAFRDPAEIPWDTAGVDIVVESTGLFTSRTKAAAHQTRKKDIKVILSAPAKEKTPEDKIDGTFVLGVNDHLFDPNKHFIISNASCTTNCLAPVVKVIMDNYGMKHGFMTTIHSYTNDQRILDLPHKDLRRARAAAVSMIPTSTGAAKALGLVIPEVTGILDGMAIRVPTPNVSLIDLACELPNPTTTDAVKAAFKNAAATGSLAGIMEYVEVPLVSHDYNHTSQSAHVDAEYIKVIDGTLLKVLAWYDNEWGYSNRLADMVRVMAGLPRIKRN
jgi:glyceraldehyde 3-phosphate dehydrogenase